MSSFISYYILLENSMKQVALSFLCAANSIIKYQWSNIHFMIKIIIIGNPCLLHRRGQSNFYDKKLDRLPGNPMHCRSPPSGAHRFTNFKPTEEKYDAKDATSSYVANPYNIMHLLWYIVAHSSTTYVNCASPLRIENGRCGYRKEYFVQHVHY